MTPDPTCLTATRPSTGASRHPMRRPLPHTGDRANSWTCAILVAVASILPGCGADPRGPPPARSDANSAAAEGAATPAAPAPVQAAPTATMPILAISGDGLDLVDPVSGSTRHLPFGTGASTVVAAVARVRGAPRERSVNGECGAGPMEFVTWNDGLSLLLQQDSFRGWSLNARAPGGAPATPPLTTMSGIGLGSTRQALEAAYVSRVTETSLGTEFAAGDLSGLFESAAPRARITALWSGVACVFR